MEPWWAETDIERAPASEITLAVKRLGVLAQGEFPGLSLPIFEAICLQALATLTAASHPGDQAAADRHLSKMIKRLRRETKFAVAVAGTLPRENVH